MPMVLGRPAPKCGVCNDTGKVLIGWIMPVKGGYDLDNAVNPGDDCPACKRSQRDVELLV